MTTPTQESFIEKMKRDSTERRWVIGLIGAGLLFWWYQHEQNKKKVIVKLRKGGNQPDRGVVGAFTASVDRSDAASKREQLEVLKQLQRLGKGHYAGFEVPETDNNHVILIPKGYSLTIPYATFGAVDRSRCQKEFNVTPAWNHSHFQGTLSLDGRTFVDMFGDPCYGSTKLLRGVYCLTPDLGNFFDASLGN